MNRARLAVLVLFAALGCSRDNSKELRPPGPAEAPDEPGWPGKRIAPPGLLRIGMTTAEAKTAEWKFRNVLRPPGFAPQISLLIRARYGSCVSEIRAMFALENEAEDLVNGFTKLWGPPEHVPGVAAPQVNVRWKSEATATAADLVCGQDVMCWLQFSQYRPLASAYFGATAAPPGPLSRLRIGMTVAEATTASPCFDGSLQAVGPDRSVAHVESNADDVVGNLWFDGEHRIYALSLDLPSAAEAERMLSSAWGAGRGETEMTLLQPTSDGVLGRINAEKLAANPLYTNDDERPPRPVLTWLDPRIGWRAVLVPLGVRDPARADSVEPAELQFYRPAVHGSP